ncbi:hypothetical protein [Microbacterium thalli]|uniref:DUF4232 domain-containing protein n=1 Tax=Microbacterium thalli TaxID=3027921 RepID=A0ABT5SJT7_9MICO|nr:hypothetical protein [Microbacterium thalli]MDD7928094.1 hypothetical protein [Microbacterium thalli]MDD7963049.1 hypothetical protein [Microbacterium thalli]
MTDTPPRRRLSPAVYRRRRLAVLLVVLLIVAAIVLALWRPWEGAAAQGGPTPALTETTDAASAPASPSATPSAEAAEPAASDSPPAEEDAEVEPCSAQSVQVSAVTDKDAYGAGELPQLSISLTNAGDAPCLLNVGTATQKLTVSSGPDVWWRSTDCQSESSDQVVQIDPGQTVSSVTPITWDRTRSSVDSCGSDRPAAPAGYFNLAVEIGGLAAQQDRQFVLR